MDRIFLISNGIQSLERGEMTTSSSKYEYDLAYYLSQHVPVTLFSTRLDWGRLDSKGNVTLIGCKDPLAGNDPKKKQAALYRQLQAHRAGSPVVIFWGYDAVAVKTMLRVKKELGIPVVSFIFDSHKPAVFMYNVLIRIRLNLRFAQGLRMTRKLDGYIFFQEAAAKRLAVGNMPYLVIKPGMGKVESLYTAGRETFTVTYCGTLSRLNGTDALVDALRYIREPNIEFRVCGYGPMTEQVKQAAEVYPFFHYEGKVDDSALTEVYRKSDLLLNLRRLDDEAMEYAFPSKTFEYVGTGVPLLTTAVLTEPEFLDNVYCLDEMSGEALASVIETAYRDREHGQERARRLKAHVGNAYSFERMATRVCEFLNGITERR